MRLLKSMVALAGTALIILVALGYGAPLAYGLDLLAHFRLHLLGLSGVVGLAALLVRDAGALWRALAAAVLAAAGLGPLWEPTGPAGAGETIVVVAANIYGLNTRPEEVLEMLVATEADVLVTAEMNSTTFADAEELKRAYPHHSSFTDPGESGDSDVAIWSKRPIQWSSPIPADAPQGFGVAAIVELGPGRELSVMGLHLDHVLLGRQGAQVEMLNEAAAKLPEPLVAMGDFNATPWSWAVRRVEALTGTRRVAGVFRTWKGEYPTPVPLSEPVGLPIDHVLVSPGIGVVEIGTLEIPGSDHLAVRAELRLPDVAGSSASASAAVSIGG